MFINPTACKMVRGKMICPDDVKKEQPSMTELMNKKTINNPDKEPEINLQYIIENKPKTKIVRNYIKEKCGGIIDEDIELFEK